MITSLKDKAMLCRLSITQWTARKLDKRVTDETNRTHGASSDAGRYNKLLIAGDALKRIQQAATAGRDAFYTLSLPWKNDGARIVPAAAYPKLSAELRRLHNAFDSAVADFVREYPAYVADARVRLNGMFNSADYPDAWEIRARFTWTVDIENVPCGDDFRVELASGEIDAIRQQINEQTQRAMAAGMRDVWQRLYDCVSHAASKLREPDAIFRDSLIGNIRDLCDILPALNFTDDNNLEQLRADVVSKLACNSPDELRDNKQARARVAADAAAIVDSMSAFMGGM